MTDPDQEEELHLIYEKKLPMKNEVPHGSNLAFRIHPK